jgi:hypothetical protein
MGKSTRSKLVPKNMQARYDQIVELIDEFCQQHLNDEYRELTQDMAAGRCRNRPSPVAQPYMIIADVSAPFGAILSIGGPKARTTSDALKLRSFNPDWTLMGLRLEAEAAYPKSIGRSYIDMNFCT